MKGVFLFFLLLLSFTYQIFLYYYSVTEDLHTVLETDDFGNYVRGITCDDFIENYPYHCENCNFYFADSVCDDWEDEKEDGCCPICGEKAD